MKNSADLEGCYPPRPSASVDNTLLDLQNSSYPTQPHSIIAKYSSSSSSSQHGVKAPIVKLVFLTTQHTESVTYLVNFCILQCSQRALQTVTFNWPTTPIPLHGKTNYASSPCANMVISKHLLLIYIHCYFIFKM